MAKFGKFYAVKYDLDSLIGKTLKIKDQDVKIKSACSTDHRKVFLAGVLRIHWFPTIVSQCNLKKRLQEAGLEILSVDNEYYKDDELKHISNGILRIKIKYALSRHRSLLDLLGIQEVVGNRILIQLSGHPP